MPHAEAGIVRSSAAVPLLLALAIFVPGHMLGWAVEWSWLAAVTGLGAIVVATRRWGGALLGIDSGLWLILFALTAGASATSMALTALRGSVINIRDLAEMLRFPIYGLFVIFLGSLASRWSVRGVDWVLRLSLWYSLACAGIYALKIPVLYDILANLIYGEAKVLFGVGYIRIPFPFENPNFLAYYLLLALGWFMFFRRSYIHIAIALVLLFLTGSRSGWLASAPLLLMMMLAEITWYSAQRRGAMRFLAATVGVLAAVAVTLSWEEIRSAARVAELLSAMGGGEVSGIESARARLTTLSTLLDWLERSPLLGWGPGRALGIDVADNQFLSWAVAWGLLGVFAAICAGALVISRLLAAARTAPYRAGIVALGASLVAMLATGDFLENYRLFFVTLVVLHSVHVLTGTAISEVPAPRELQSTQSTAVAPR